jgi:hypothetical protein
VPAAAYTAAFFAVVGFITVRVAFACNVPWFLGLFLGGLAGSFSRHSILNGVPQGSDSTAHRRAIPAPSRARS